MSATILPFAPLPRDGSRMTKQERVLALAWAGQCQLLGYQRAALEIAADEDDFGIGDYLLVYERNALWASWGVGYMDGRFVVWQPRTLETVSSYTTLRRALDSIPPLGAAFTPPIPAPCVTLRTAPAAAE